MSDIIHLKENINLTGFLSRVKECKDEVFFETNEGDSLALRSILCQYVFCSLIHKPEILYNGTIRFVDENDFSLLCDYLVTK